jgi:adenosylcobinamide amidohydrolase
VAFLTAADVTRFRRVVTDGVEVTATVGLGWPVYAAAEDPNSGSGYTPGTINIVVLVPAVLTDAALVNAVITVTEAKTQALLEAGVPGTGTASDAVCILAHAASEPADEEEQYGGPRSTWGSRIARAVHTAVLDGARDWCDRAGSE